MEFYSLLFYNANLDYIQGREFVRKALSIFTTLIGGFYAK